MNEFFHVEHRNVCISAWLDIELFLEVDPANGFGTVQGVPTVQNVDLATSVTTCKQFFAVFEDGESRFWIKPMRHDHMATYQKNGSPLHLNIASSCKDKLVVCILSPDLICHDVESVKLRQRAWSEIFRKIALLCVPTQGRHWHHDVFCFKGVVSHLFCLISIE